MTKKPKVTEVEITTLSDVEHVRQRRGMYLPSMNYCAYEIVDNAVDEFMAGHCKNIWVQIEPDKTLRVQDDGRGVPITPAKDDPSKSMAEVALGQLKSGGKFNAKGSMSEQGIKTGGLNGTGSSAVNFTCDNFVATITKAKKQYQLAWEKGILTTPLTLIGNAEEDEVPNGTLIELMPDMTIWTEDDYDIKAINKRLEQLTFLNPGLSIHTDLKYDNKEIEASYVNPDGLKAYINALSEKKDVMVDPICFSGFINLKNQKIYYSKTSIPENEIGDIVDVDIALGYNTGYSEEVYMFTNNVPNPLGGHHLTGFKEGLFRSINNYYTDNSKGKLINLISDDVREGLIAVVSIKIANPVFDGQGKAKLTMPITRAAVREATMEMMNDFLDKNPDSAKIIVSKALDAQSTREKVRKTREADRAAKRLGGNKTPDKLTECSSKDPEKSEIWLTEGDSAGGSCKKARNADTQAILPVFGKINNVEGATLSNVLDSVKLEDVINALGCNIGEEFDINKLKYHKIIIAADADDDGLHIQTLWLTFFYRFLRPIIEEGYLYISCPPLFKVYKNKKEFDYCYTIEEKDQLLEEWGEKCLVTRYKGLGEMLEEDLRLSTMSPEHRTLIQVSMEDIEGEYDPEYDELIVSTCMGDNVALRKEMILDEEMGELV